LSERAIYIGGFYEFICMGVSYNAIRKNTTLSSFMEDENEEE